MALRRVEVAALLFLFAASTALVLGDGLSCTRRVHGEGFHRVVSTLCRGRGDGEESDLAVVDVLPPSLFVDPFELADRARLGFLPGVSSVAFFPGMDLEQPADRSPPHVLVSVLSPRAPARADNSVEWAADVPVHLRYQAPSPAGEHVAVAMLPPVLFSTRGPSEGLASARVDAAWPSAPAMGGGSEVGCGSPVHVLHANGSSSVAVAGESFCVRETGARVDVTAPLGWRREACSDCADCAAVLLLPAGSLGDEAFVVAASLVCASAAALAILCATFSPRASP